MSDRPTIGEAHWPDTGEFVTLASRWRPDAVTRLLGFVWKAWDLLREEVLSDVDCKQADRDLERSVTQYLEPRIDKVMPDDSPFYVQHGAHEFETARKPPAQPPLPDLAFVLWANPRVSWPLEAKVMRTDAAVGPYVKEICDNFMTCRYGPFSSEAGLLGYLVEGEPERAFSNIAVKTPCEMKPHPDFADRDHRTSEHTRRVPPGKPYPRSFRCHHMILRLAG